MEAALLVGGVFLVLYFVGLAWVSDKAGPAAFVQTRPPNVRRIP